MILVDTSVWIDHIRSAEPIMNRLLQEGQVLIHTGVIGELAVGSIKSRTDVLTELHQLPRAIEAEPRETLIFIDRHKLYGLGIGYIDAQLLASVHLNRGATLWSRDKRLSTVARRLGVNALVEPQA